MRAAGQWKDCPFGCDKIINPQRGNKCSFDQMQPFVAKAMTEIAMSGWRWRRKLDGWLRGVMPGRGQKAGTGSVHGGSGQSLRISDKSGAGLRAVRGWREQAPCPTKPGERHSDRQRRSPPAGNRALILAGFVERPGRMRGCKLAGFLVDQRCHHLPVGSQRVRCLDEAAAVPVQQPGTAIAGVVGAGS